MDPPVAGVAALRPWFTGKEEGPRWIRWEAPGSWFTGREEGPSWTRWWQGSQHWDRGSPAKRQDRGGPASVKEEASSWIRWKLLGLWFTRKEETLRRVTRQEKAPGQRNCCGRRRHAAAAIIQRFWRRRAMALIAEDGRRLWNLQACGCMRQKVERDCVLSNQKHDIWRAARGTADDGGQLWKEPDIAVEATTMDPIASWIPEDLATDLSDGLFDIFEDEAGEKLILVPKDDAGDVQDAGNPQSGAVPRLRPWTTQLFQPTLRWVSHLLRRRHRG